MEIREAPSAIRNFEIKLNGTEIDILYRALNYYLGYGPRGTILYGADRMREELKIIREKI